MTSDEGDEDGEPTARPTNDREPDALRTLIGSSPAMRTLRDDIARLARSDRPVLVTGPTGAGKELAVRALHLLSRRAHSPFVDVNCGALPDALFESQLFGHERGSFTGAERRHDGFFQTAGDGTLFLDEIAELPLTLQPKLLRVLETGTFRPVSGPATLRFHGRVVAATHANLEARVREGRFREDLLFRLNVFELTIPSLADRRSDMPELVRFLASLQSRPLHFTDEAIELLTQRDWPGNVRQLRNAVERIAVLAPEGPITPKTIAPILGIAERAREEVPRVTSISSLIGNILERQGSNKLRMLEQALLGEALRRSDGNKAAAARILGVHRRVIERRLKHPEASE